MLGATSIQAGKGECAVVDVQVSFEGSLSSLGRDNKEGSKSVRFDTRKVDVG